MTLQSVSPKMNELSVSGVSIKGLAAAVPSKREDNSQLDSLSEKARNEIIEQVGIRYRFIAPPEVTAADLCQTSAEKLISELGWKPQEIGLLVFVTQTPDHIVPGTATQLQHKLGLDRNAICLDINQGCSGYVYGLSVVSGMMKSYNIDRALLLVGDTITRMISKEDNSLRPIFSDAGSATALELDAISQNKMTFRLGSKGDAFEAIHVSDGGARNPMNARSLVKEKISEGVLRQRNQLSMNGQAVFTFGLSVVASEISALLESEKKTEKDIDHLVLHQANQLLNNAIVRKVGFPKEKAPSSLHDFGNTSCATVPITLVSQLREAMEKETLQLLLSGFGVGLSWGNVILSTDRIICPEIIYL
ncbi:MAG: ketoacyl-ACP synthase III [Flavobacteriales bacterium]|nr:ketoacyl-ACP synthase III [Flavobacteriales bacterium]